ncbi:unnamed protein product [Mytilus coruscus]|uniref:Uncharacterized protein n=1 Tax=Mytilus coruscus TaxID=42192 RepID=A0A6J8B9W7_MYTCO|nr:unnamed protein product [Mytilus coruscus]
MINEQTGQINQILNMMYPHKVTGNMELSCHKGSESYHRSNSVYTRIIKFSDNSELYGVFKMVFDEQKIHPKFKGAIDHEIVNIKEVGLQDLSGGDLRAHQTKIEIKVSRQFSTDMGAINSMSSCPDGSVWLKDSINRVVKHVKLTEDNIEVISQFDISVTEVAVTLSNNILISVDRARLKMINEQTGQISDSEYDVSPLQTWSCHVTKDQRVIIGAITPGPLFSDNSRGVVMVFDEEGKHPTVYEYDNHNKPLGQFLLYLG